MTRLLEASFDQIQDTFILTTSGSREYVFRILDLFHQSTGWTTQIESDGLTRNTGEQITGDGTGANGVNDGAYSVQQNSDGVEIMWQITAGTATNTTANMAFTYRCSPVDGFTGGTATVAPTATDQGQIVSTQQYETLDNNQLGTTQHICIGAVESVAPFRFFAMILEDASNGSCKGAWGKTDCAKSTAHPFLDDRPDRSVYWHSAGSNSMDSTGISAFAYFDASPPATTANFLACRATAIFYAQGNLDAAVPYTSSGMVTTLIRWGRTTSDGAPRGCFGIGSDEFKFKMFNDGGAAQWRSSADSDPDTGSTVSRGSAFGCNDFIFKWLGSEAAGDSGDRPPWSDNGVPQAANFFHYPEEQDGVGGPVAPDAPAAVTGGLTNFTEDAFLNYFRGVTPTAPGTVYISLHTAEPGEDGLVGEIVGNGYARQTIGFGAPASGSGIMSNNTAPVFTAAGGDWGLPTHFAIWDAVSAGNALKRGALNAEASVVDGDTVTVAIGSVFLSLG